MKLLRLLILIAALVALATAAYGQFDDFDTSAPPAPPWTTFKLNPKTHVTVDFRNASVDGVLHVLSVASGIPIIKDPSLTGGLTVQSPKPLSLSDAFALVNAALNLKNFGFTREGNFLEVKPSQPAGGFGRFGAGGGGSFGGRGSRNELRVYSIKYADATSLATTINNLYAPTPGQTTPALGVTGPGNPNAPVAAGTPGAQGAGGGGFGRGRFGGGAGAGQASQPEVKASAESYSNSLIINAPSSLQDEISQIIDQIDKPTQQPMQTRVFRLSYAIATDVQPIVQNVLSSTVPLGRGNTTANRPNPNLGPGGGPGGFFARLISASSNQNAGGTVTAYANSNALVVTTTSENLNTVADVIQQLDKPAAYQSTTFVYVLKNARADVVANLLNESFGNRTTNGPVGGSLTNTGPSQSTINVTSATGTTGVGGIGGSAPTSLASNGTGYRGNTNNNQYGAGTTSSTTQNAEVNGFDAEGHVINVRNLYGQVLLVPNIDMNSIIVVAPPEDQPLVKSILDEMDEIPEQVMIETLVMEVSLTKANQFGVEWSFLNNTPFGLHSAQQTGTQSFGLQANTTQPEGLRYTLTTPQFQAFLQALQTDTKFNVLSTPRIFTTNNATAQINISQALPYVTNQTVDTTGTVLYNYNFLDVGIVLTVTPRITEDGYVTMDVSQSADDFVSYTSFNAPIVNQRETETTVSVKDGETIVLGGIISDQVSDTVNKIPILGDIPLVGNLFRSVNKSDQKTELLVFLTPHVVRDPSDAIALRQQTEAELGRTAQQMIPKSAAPTTPASSPASPSADPGAAPDPSAAEPAQPAATAPNTPVSGPAPMTPAPGTGPVSTLPPPSSPTVTVTTK